MIVTYAFPNPKLMQSNPYNSHEAQGSLEFKSFNKNGSISLKLPLTQHRRRDNVHPKTQVQTPANSTNNAPYGYIG